jgi:glycine cleavage system aminomethyltransferase T
MTYPNEQLPAGRPLKRAPAYSAMTEAGCQWGQSWDLEVPLYFGGKGFEETPSLKRSNAHEVVGAECRAVREGVGLLDISGFSRYEVSGPNAEAWLDGLFSTTLPKPGRARLAVALGHDGRLKGDLTLFNWGDGTWWIMGSYYLRTWHMRWFNDHMQDGVSRARPWRGHGGFSLSGPKSRAVIEKLSEDAVGALPFMGCGEFDIGLMRCKVGRMSVSGELGYEIHCRMGDHISLREALLEAGADRGDHRIRVQRAPVAAAGEELRHLERGVHPRLHGGHDRHGSLDQLDKGDFIGKRRRWPSATATARAEGRDAGGRRHRRRCQRVRAGLEGRQARGLRHLRRLRAHGGQIARHGDGEHRPDGAGDGPERAYRRRGTGGPRDPALAL